MIKINLIFLFMIYFLSLTLTGCTPSQYTNSSSSSNPDSVTNNVVSIPLSNDNTLTFGTITAATTCFHINNSSDSGTIDTDLKSFLINYQNKEFAVLLFMKTSNCDINQLYQVTLCDASHEGLEKWMNNYNQSLSLSNISSNDQQNLPIISKYFTQAIKNTLMENYPNLPVDQMIKDNPSNIYDYIDPLRNTNPNSDISNFQSHYTQSADDPSTLYHIGQNIIGDVSQLDISDDIINTLLITLRKNGS